MKLRQLALTSTTPTTTTTTTLRPILHFLNGGSSFSSPIIHTVLIPHRRLSNSQPSLSSSSSKRHTITPLNDNGHTPWSDLSIPEKAGRTVQQTINLSLVLLGLTLTSGVFYLLYTEVFSSDSKTAHFNSAFDRIRSDPRCVELLGDGKKLKAFGEESPNSWRKARPIASTITKDRYGSEHLRIEFNVQGPRGLGRVNIHMTKKPGQHEFKYQYFFVDVRGHQRIWLENTAAAAAAATKQAKKGEAFKLFGVKWS